MSDFEVLRSLSGPLLPAVIVTAFDHHAIEAFRASATDYPSKDQLRPVIDAFRRQNQRASENHSTGAKREGKGVGPS